MLEDSRQKTVAAAVSLADSLPRARLVVFTRHGTMARYVSNLRPQHAPIFAFTPNEDIYRQLSVSWGVFAVQIEFTNDPNATIKAAERYLLAKGLAGSEDNLVVLTDLHAGETLVDCVQLRQLQK